MVQIRYAKCQEAFDDSIDEDTCSGCDSMDVCISLHPDLGKVLFKDGNSDNGFNYLGKEEIIFLLLKYPSVFPKDSRDELKEAVLSDSFEGGIQPTNYHGDCGIKAKNMYGNNISDFKSFCEDVKHDIIRESICILYEIVDNEDLKSVVNEFENYVEYSDEFDFDFALKILLNLRWLNYCVDHDMPLLIDGKDGLELCGLTQKRSNSNN
jgi:hypothetical protein